MPESAEYALASAKCGLLVVIEDFATGVGKRDEHRSAANEQFTFLQATLRVAVTTTNMISTRAAIYYTSLQHSYIDQTADD